MSVSPSTPRVEILAGWRAPVHLLRYRLSMLRYALQPRRFPLFFVRRSAGGLLRTASLRRELSLRRIPRLGPHTYWNLTFPRWPSAAFDHMVARGGLNVMAAGSPRKRQIDNALLSLTRQCRYACRHCYESSSLGPGKELSTERWCEVVASLQARGVSVITLTGGEPMLCLDRLIAVLRAGNKDLSDFHVHTSGHAVTPEVATGLRRAGVAAVGVGLDLPDPEGQARLRRYPAAFAEATSALAALRDAGIFTYLNTCATTELVRGDGLRRHLALARDLGVGIVRYLEPRPSGALVSRDCDELLTASDRVTLREFYVTASEDPSFEGFPLLQYPALAEAKVGCQMGGLSVFAIDPSGDVRPCVFVPVSFGNVANEGVDAVLARMAADVPFPLAGPCPALTLQPAVVQQIRLGARLPVSITRIRREWTSLFESNAGVRTDAQVRLTRPRAS